ncbi:MMPL family transporter [Nocardia stercoris]|uniref:MMPL family transporter n=1 Tax=Nocardia stercoris TaxID=2483361 RepID=A0A3M2L9N7_9NOCA|nr:MMPL family transporter [Nocardia stercoris]RMI34277.1 MMPL family transporter [Nocardia stercoris]
MSVYLYRWGKFAFRRKWLVLPAWIAILIMLAGIGFGVHKPFQDKFSAPNLPSQQATDILDKHFPGMSAGFSQDAITGTYVIAAPDGQKLTDPKNADALTEFVHTLSALNIVKPSSVQDPLAATRDIGSKQNPPIDCLDNDPSTPGFAGLCSGAPVNVMGGDNAKTVAVVNAQFNIEKFSDITDADRKAANAVADDARKAGLDVELTGVIAQNQPQDNSTMIGIVIALIVMAIAFGALIAAFTPILTAIFGLGSATAVISGLTSVTSVPTFTPVLATMIGLALSIDYALFIVSRYKHELTVQDSPEEAAGVAIGTAGSAVVFAGLTVIIALAGLSTVGVSFLTFMGIGGALAAFFAVSVAVTLLPAFMGAFGRFLFKPKLPLVAKHDPEDPNSKTVGLRIARGIAKAPAVTLALAVVILGLLALPATGMQLGLPGGDSSPAGSSARKAYDLQTKGFGEGSNGKLLVAVDLANVAPEQRDQAVNELRDKLAGYPGMAYLTNTGKSKDGEGAMFSGVPKSGPNNQATTDLVINGRAAEADFKAKYGMEYGITGSTAMQADFNELLLSKVAPYLAIVAGAAFVLLMLVFRSILVPLTAALGFLLSMAATFGATVLIFQQDKLGLIGSAHPIISFLPIMLIGLVFGLAMDYQVFLVTRMREEYVHGKSPKEAMITGYQHGARVVTSAAIIMMAVFASFILSPDVTSKSMGFALTAGVFFDAFIVRMIVIPSLLALMGKWAWWLPAWLDRILPNIDVEGAKLTALRPQDDPDSDTVKQPVTV